MDRPRPFHDYRLGHTSPTQRTRLAQVAAKCPVHKTLDKGVHLEDHVSFA